MSLSSQNRVSKSTTRARHQKVSATFKKSVLAAVYGISDQDVSTEAEETFSDDIVTGAEISSYEDNDHWYVDNTVSDEEELEILLDTLSNEGIYSQCQIKTRLLTCLHFM